jgi:hypothetical protein
VVAFLIISPVAGLSISLLNTAILFAVFPGALPTGPAYNLAATLSMQIGIFSTHMIAKKMTRKTTEQHSSELGIKWATASTTMGMLTRAAIMSIILYFALPQPPPIGFGLNQTETIAYLPLAGLFNATLALYTIPIAYLIANRVNKVLKINLFI